MLVVLGDTVMIGDDVGKQVQASMKSKVVVLGDTISMLVQRSL